MVRGPRGVSPVEPVLVPEAGALLLAGAVAAAGAVLDAGAEPLVELTEGMPLCPTLYDVQPSDHGRLGGPWVVGWSAGPAPTCGRLRSMSGLAVLGLALAACTPLGATVAQRAEAALAKAPSPAGSPAKRETVAALERQTAAFLARKLDFEHYRTSVAEYLESYAQVVEAHLLALPRLSPEQALEALDRLARITVRVETHVASSPPDWYSGTWEAYVAEAGCDSDALEVLELGLDHARAHALQGPTRQRMAVEVRRIRQVRAREDE